MSEIDQQFIEYVVKSLVGKPDAVHIDRRIDEKGVLLELTVDPEDLGRVIGKRGATAQSLRTLLRALGTKNDARYNLKIIDNGTGAPGQSSNDTTNDDAPAGKPDEPDEPDKPKKAAKSESAEPAKEEEASEGTGSPATTEATVDEPETAAEEPEAPAAETEPEPEPAASHEDGTTDRLAQARKELADLDDLDV